MAMRIVTVNQFVQVYRKHSAEHLSVEALMGSPSQAAKLANQALGVNDAHLQTLARSLLEEINGATARPLSPPTPAQSPSAPAGSPAPSSSPSVESAWALISQAAREVSGPMGGLIVTKFRKENPALTPDQAIPKIREKLGDSGPEFAKLCKR